MAIITYLLLFVSVLVGAQAEVCWYWDDILDEEDSIICYSGCCGDDCCDDYWSDGSIAGATVGSIIGSIILLSIFIAILRICCAASRRSSGGVIGRRVPGATQVVTVSSTNTANNLVATPYVRYLQATQMTNPVAPPAYEQVVQDGARSGVVNPNYAYGPPKY
ncbi:uncharacterized protein LOC110442607 [Mizuhopecten yessoensis]|uniref:Cysteine and tyrosine-rich protein 1 n=1 Tax=Mizuhopecten yessoensis TaxID=6573 RepID=A0A210PGT9_MIZYE|nr:uncharacterized protein LOC110442607 [Mizuhopecten yessoensis]OWF35699.1 hypothetical protein KP79_PYT03305 [Mizuhopecten yessoensis]